MTVKKVVMYKTSKGTLFDKEKLAAKEEEKEIRLKDFEKYYGDFDNCLLADEVVTNQAMVYWLNEHKEAVLKYYGGKHEENKG